MSPITTVAGESGKPDMWSLLVPLIKWILEFHDWTSWLGAVLLIAVAVSASMAALRGLRWILEQFVAVVLQLKKLKGSQDGDAARRVSMRRRQQFCTVLRSDLDVIAKAENWNDQWFTDLEAEVEAEGRYFRTLLDRLLNRRVSGYRKEQSLVRAITRSAERCLLLVGEPGSGKSVALRHVGRQLAEEGSRSRDPRAFVPLYINLRDLPDLRGEALSVDGIQRFVLDNIRRGDADTAAYVREKWQEYKEQGVWMFLFDSFDEIPAVLHSASGSSMVRQYTDAIRKFMDGMGACKGILASREFKGPEAVPWQKLRILALDTPRQAELIANALLTPDQQRLVQRHLASSDGVVFRNPLFLSVLCRYVRDKTQQPPNDYDLIYQQIERLAGRDVDYLRNKYNFEPQEILNGARLLAALIAQNDKLGLSPRWELLASAWEASRLAPCNVLDLIAALVDLKIGRADVKEAKAGDRLFAFSHRRYQETLFVDYLAARPEALPDSLLLDTRWREYAVTFLQSQPVSVLASLVNKAGTLLEEWSHSGRQDVAPEFGGRGHYYLWSSDREVHLLRLLHQGFSGRQEGAPDELRRSAERLLLPRWEQGDAYDRWMVLQVAPLLPTATVERLLTGAIKERTEPIRRAAFAAVGSVSSLQPTTRAWFCEELADDCMLARDVVELNRVELLCAKLPAKLQADLIFRRCLWLRTLLRPIAKLLRPFLYLAMRTTQTPSSNNSPRRLQQLSFTATVTYSALGTISLLVSLLFRFVSARSPAVNPGWLGLVLIMGCLLALGVFAIYFCRAWPGNLNAATILRIMGGKASDIAAAFKSRDALLALGGFVIFCILLGLMGHYDSAAYIVAGMYVIGLVLGITAFVRRKQVGLRVRRAQRNGNARGVLDARTAIELAEWITPAYTSTLTTASAARSLLRLLEQLPLQRAVGRNADKPLFSVEPGKSLPNLKRVLLLRILEFDES